MKYIQFEWDEEKNELNKKKLKQFFMIPKPYWFIIQIIQMRKKDLSLWEFRKA